MGRIVMKGRWKLHEPCNSTGVPREDLQRIQYKRVNGGVLCHHMLRNTLMFAEEMGGILNTVYFDAL